jgi:hypothetical protein
MSQGAVLYHATNGVTLTSPLPINLHLSSSLPTPLSAVTRHTIFAFVTPIFVSFVQIKYENKYLTPFDTHPIAINASILNFLIYCISSIAETKLNPAVDDNIYILVCGHISDLSAALVVTLLASIIFPVSLRWFTYIAYMLLLVRVFFSLISWLTRWIYEKTRKAVQFALKFIHTLVTRFSVSHLWLHHQDPALLPV